MKTGSPVPLISILLVSVLFSCDPQTVNDRETVLDSIVHVEPEIIYDVPDADRWCDIIDLEKRRINVGDCELYVEIEGEGTPLVLLHGGPGGTHHYFHPEFSRAAEFAQVVYYDQRGCGLSDYQPGEGYTVSQAVDDLENLRKALAIDRWVVLGYSYGGLLAQKYVTRYPARVKGLVLVSSAPAMMVELQPTRQYDFISPVEMERINEVRATPNLTREQRLFNAHLNGDWKRQSFYRPTRERLARMARYEWHHDTDFNPIMGRHAASVDLTGAFEKMPIPTLIIEGKWDLTWNTDKPEILHRNHPNAEITFFERSGHNSFDDEPEQFFRTLRNFLSGLDRIPAPELTEWKNYLEEWEAEMEMRKNTFTYLVRAMDFSLPTSRKIVELFAVDRFQELHNPYSLLRVGFALYDEMKYEEALQAFRIMEKRTMDLNEMFREVPLIMSLLWQAHMYDLMNGREKAIALYQRVVEMENEGNFGHSQYGLSYRPSSYAAKRIEVPFERLENIECD
jgi:proline iminopeptidase